MYKLKSDGGVMRLNDGASIPNDPKNRDWRKYQEWLAEGNLPDPADPPPPAPPFEPSAGEMLDAVGDAIKLADTAKLDALLAKRSG